MSYLIKKGTQQTEFGGPSRVILYRSLWKRARQAVNQTDRQDLRGQPTCTLLDADSIIRSSRMSSLPRGNTVIVYR